MDISNLQLVMPVATLLALIGFVWRAGNKSANFENRLDNLEKLEPKIEKIEEQVFDHEKTFIELKALLKSIEVKIEELKR